MLDSILSPTGPFCLIQGDQLCGGSEQILLLHGDRMHPQKLVDIPRSGGPAPGKVCYDTVSMVPFCQISERGFKAHSEGETIITLQVTASEMVALQEFTTAVPETPIELESSADGPLVYDTSREAYAAVIETVKHKMIACGEGSSFVTPRKCSGAIAEFSHLKALTIFRRLLLNEYGCYWKFLFYDNDGHYFVGASPERQLTVRHEQVQMNPISGTFRKTPTNTPAQERAALLEFLKDEKEIDELWMVTDEELKMMAAMCTSGGDVLGPYLKEMGALLHTEYLLNGAQGGRDLIDLFRISMFAPTVTGSPMGNACACCYSLESGTRSYYSSAIMVMGREADGKEFLDSSITIRTIELSTSGHFSIRVGATLVKDSVPMDEVEETEVKIRGAIRSLTTNSKPAPPLNLGNDEAVQTLLASRNARLSKFWMERQDKAHVVNPLLRGQTAVVMSNEDDFAMMLCYQLRCMGLKVTVHPFDQCATPPVLQEMHDAAFVLVGPGPGDPTNDTHEKMKIVQSVLSTLQERKQRFMAVCLGHQVLCRMLGFAVVKKASPTQGVQKECSFFGGPQKLGFYNAFCVRADAARAAELGLTSVATLDEELIGFKAPHFASMQCHPESILTQNGFALVNKVITELLSDTTETPAKRSKVE
eukprot:NODE_490_length_2154_cov_55.909225_g454_i0.p1 GENE.NODE_490_length_2154_cov_55.909225_g454_i0~~NODE_490_length_2154_cov_55.909225_g454_i0.p1  ORF type:complete len:661 (+),score=247.42 NODE_490_length_2154_cov_55.909225_g454_i0:40-1983(+)